MLDEYYQLRGWNEDGIPTTTTTERLNIEPFVPPEVDLPELGPVTSWQALCHSFVDRLVEPRGFPFRRRDGGQYRD